MRYFAIDGTDHATHREQASIIRRYIIWRYRNAHDRARRSLVKRANAVERGTSHSLRLMKDSDLEAAIVLARATVGADESVPVKTFPVRRLDRDSNYVLVQLGEPGRPGWLVAVDVDQRDVMTSAANESGESTVPTSLPPALAAREGELVWRPSRSSASPLYPLLRIANDVGEWFIDLAGDVSTTLSDGRA